MKIYISIATYNEKENIEQLIRDLFSLRLPGLSVIIVDDNSPDGTAQIIKQLQSLFPRLILIKRAKKLGYGSAQIQSFKRALAENADLVISMDADFSHDPQAIIPLVESIKNGADLAVGSRRVSGGQIIGWNLWRHFCSAGAMASSRFILGIKTKDPTSGFKAYRRSVLETINLNKIRSNGYAFQEEIVYLIEKHDFKVTEIPIVFQDRKLGRSKLSRSEIVKFFIMIFQIKFLNKG
jgi:dolichol-phosphate mannosyltransferase